MRLSARSIGRWQDGVRENFLPLDFSGHVRGEFLASMTARRLGCAQIACIGTQAYRVARTRKLANQSEARYLKLFWQIAGMSCIEQGGRAGDLAPGSWTFYDTSRPYSIESSDSSRFAVMLLPQEQCPNWHALFAEKSGLPFHSNGASRVALASVMTALRDPEPYDALAADTVVASISALMFSALKRESGGAVQPANRARLAEACRYIVERIDDPALTPEDVAAALRVSRRTLYAWFAQSGLAPFAFIQQTRLERCRQTLADPAAFEKNITRIAFDHGFSDMAHFSRLFKAAYGASPRDYRRRYTL
jgi:AraC-like DNA-binding protein